MSKEQELFNPYRHPAVLDNGQVIAPLAIDPVLRQQADESRDRMVKELGLVFDGKIYGEGIKPATR